MKSSLTVDDIGYHPTGGTATDNKDNVIELAGPIIPEISYGTGHIRALCIHCRQFIDKDDTTLTTVHLLLQCIFQHDKSRHPIFRHLRHTITVIAHRIGKCSKLVFQRAFDNSCHLECKLIPEHLIYQERLAYAPTPI